MSIDRIVHSIAGTMILGSLALAHYHNPNWIWVTVFVGANLFQSGLSNWCLMSRLLAMAGVQNRSACGLPGGR
jgi:hypothetical protein